VRRQMCERDKKGACATFARQRFGLYFTEMCSGSEAGSYLRLIDFVYHSTLGLRRCILWQVRWQMRERDKKEAGTSSYDPSHSPTVGS